MQSDEYVVYGRLLGVALLAQTHDGSQHQTHLRHLHHEPGSTYRPIESKARKIRTGEARRSRKSSIILVAARATVARSVTLQVGTRWPVNVSPSGGASHMLTNTNHASTTLGLPHAAGARVCGTSRLFLVWRRRTLLSSVAWSVSLPPAPDRVDCLAGSAACGVGPPARWRPQTAGQSPDERAGHDLHLPCRRLWYRLHVLGAPSYLPWPVVIGAVFLIEGLAARLPR